MVKSTDDYKHFHMRMPLNTWMFLKKMSMMQAVPMSDVVVNCVGKYEEKVNAKMSKMEGFEQI